MMNVELKQEIKSKSHDITVKQQPGSRLWEQTCYYTKCI